jgi:hypothetical protein
MNKKFKKLLGLKVGVQREEKRKKKCFLSWKAYFLLVIFSLPLFLCTLKIISRA